jgi:hypothetical protein
MTSTDAPVEAGGNPPAHDIAFIVDGQRKTVPTDVVSYTEVVELAYPGQSGDPQYTFTVTFRNAADEKQGTLVPGQTVTVKKEGTVFNVTRTTKS